MKVGKQEYGMLDPHTNPSYYTYKPGFLAFVHCTNFDKKCRRCKEPLCDGPMIVATLDGIVGEKKRLLAQIDVRAFLLEANKYTDVEKLMETLSKYKGEK